VALRGGDYVTNIFGEGATVSFCFYSYDKKYGLTVAHVFRRVGDVVCAFSTDTRGPNGKYQISQIGHIVSFDANTDSAVFEIKRWVDIENLRLAPESGLWGPLKITDLDTVPTLKIGSSLVGFGAQRRGAVGVVSEFWDESKEGRQLPVLDGDIFIVSGEPRAGEKAITDDGDCGTIFLDENGIPRYFHHAFGRTKRPPFIYKSMGVPFHAVIAGHPGFLGGHEAETRPLMSHQSSLLQRSHDIKDAPSPGANRRVVLTRKFHHPIAVPSTTSWHLHLSNGSTRRLSI